MLGCRLWGYSGVTFPAGCRMEVLSGSEIALQIAEIGVRKESRVDVWNRFRSGGGRQVLGLGQSAGHKLH